MNMLKLYNTLTKQIEEVQKSVDHPDHFNMYTCGPTVYNYAHIGNLRSYIMADLLYRTLKYDGYRPHWVMNITDIDDKTIKGTVGKFGTSATVQNLYDYTEDYFTAFKDDLRQVNVLVDEISFIRVTDKMKEIQEFIVELVKKGYAYVADDGIYFSIEKYQKDFGDYGHLVGEKFLEGKKVGARVQVDEYEKDNLSDFALWKNHNAEMDAQIFWEDLVGDSEVHISNGRPGWHIECSVINKVAFKGEATDIHTGGVDLMFPHHTNEIAQSQALLGKGNFVHHWFHSEHLLVDGKKMSKSLGNFYTLENLRETDRSAGLALRFLMFQSKYSVQQNFTTQALKSSVESYNKALSLFYAVDYNIKNTIPKFDKYATKALADLIDNLNSPLSLSRVYELLADGILSLEEKASSWLQMDLILGFGFKAVYDDYYESKIESDHVEDLIRQRLQAKELKDYSKSDQLRQQIEDLGYEVKDTAEGQKVKKKISI